MSPGGEGRRALLALALSAGLPVFAAPQERAGGPVAAVLSSDSEHYRRALEGFSSEWGPGVERAFSSGSLPSRTRALAAFGSKAASRVWAAEGVAVVCLAPSAAKLSRPGLTRVALLGDPATLAARLKALAPGLPALRVIWSSEASREDAEALTAALAEARISATSERIFPPSRLPERLRALGEAAGALWILPDPDLVNEKNFSILREYAAARKTLFIAPTEGLAERGATLSLSVSFADLGRQAARTLRERLEGRTGPSVVRSTQVFATVNAGAARAAGLSLRLDQADKVLP